MDHVTVTLEWTPDQDLANNIVVNITVLVDPQPLTYFKFAVNTFRWNLTLTYYISYSVKVLSSICGHSSTVANTTLKYGE